MLFDPQNCFRILVIDDNPHTHEILRRMLFKPLPVKPESQFLP
jgi:hypothetical protein